MSHIINPELERTNIETCKSLAQNFNEQNALIIFAIGMNHKGFVFCNTSVMEKPIEKAALRRALQMALEGLDSPAQQILKP